MDSLKDQNKGQKLIVALQDGLDAAQTSMIEHFEEQLGKILADNNENAMDSLSLDQRDESQVLFDALSVVSRGVSQNDSNLNAIVAQMNNQINIQPQLPLRVRKSIVFKLSTIIEPSRTLQFGEDSRQPLKSISYHKNSFESTMPVLSFKKQG